MPTKKSRKYCCICSNYRGKEVNGKLVSLHRFPANAQLRRIWLQRSRLVRKDFVYTQNSQMCSHHFVQLSGPSKNHTLPSIFPNKEFKTSSVEYRYNENDESNNMVAVPSSVEEDNMVIDEQPHASFNSEISNPQSSVLFHDYCGSINSNSFTRFVHKDVQATVVTETTNVGIQCNLLQGDVQNRPVCLEIGTQTSTLQKYTCDSSCQLECPMLTYEDVKRDNQKVMFYTGIPDSQTFEALFDEIKGDAICQTARNGATSEQGRPRSLRVIDEFFLVLMRLRLGLLLEDLADRFYISTSLCSTIFNKWLDYLDIQLAFLVKWPSRKAVDDHMPLSFRKKYPKCRIIIDCTELHSETPASLQHKSLMYSDYKSHMTWKGLVGISPAGVITFVSDLWAGSVSDKIITRDSGLLELCEEGDAIMADKGFLISDLTTPLGIHLIIPPFKKSKKQFTRREVEETRNIANLRIHVERQMERIKNFNILRTNMQIVMSKQVSKIWKICARLTALQPPLCK